MPCLSRLLSLFSHSKLPQIHKLSPPREREKERIQTILGDFFLLSTVYLPSLVLFCFFGFLMAKWEGPTWGCSQLNEELNVTSVICEMNVKIL